MGELDVYLSKLLKDFKSDHDCYTGYLEGDGQYTPFIYSLKRLGYAFSTRDSRRKYGEDQDKALFMYSHDRGDVRIGFIGSPFHLTDVISMECSQGPIRVKKLTPAIKQELAEDHAYTTKRRHTIQSTKRIGCPAKLSVKGVRLYTDPEYKKSLEGLKKNSRQHHKLMAKLREEFKNPTSTMTTCDRFYIKMSKEECHSHPTIATDRSQIIHPKLKQKIQDLVKGNRHMCSTKMIKMQLDEYVRDMCKEDSSMPLPNPLNRCFYPTRKTIYNAIYSTIFQINKSKYDQEALEEMIKVWVKESPEDKFFFRPFKDNGGNNEDETVDTLLFCFQTKWQQDLMKTYGNDISLLDVYKTTKYALPLFFVTVKTNAAYCVVATFIVQSEAASKIKEALSLISSWNEDWKPLYFMTDHSEAEMNVITEVFPDATVYFCSFHREQSWHRWLKKNDDSTAADDTAIKKLWGDVAKCRNVDEYAVCLDAWNNSQVCRDNPSARQYFDTEWLPHVQRWVPAFQSDDFLWKVAANRGLEDRDQIVKLKFPHCWADKTLSGMVSVVHDQLLPDSIAKYIEANAKMNPKHDSFSNSLPGFLRDRPTDYITHVLSRYKAASTEITYHDVMILRPGTFSVQRDIVDVNKATCSCHDFAKWHLPCEHMCAVFLYWPGVSFEDLPATYRNHPYFLVDVPYATGITDFMVVLAEPQYGCSSPEDKTSCSPTAADVDMSPTAADVDMSPPVPDVDMSPPVPDEDYPLRLAQSQLRAKLTAIMELTYTVTDIDKIQTAMDQANLMKKCLTDAPLSHTSTEGLILLSSVVGQQSSAAAASRKRTKKNIVQGNKKKCVSMSGLS